MSHFTRGIRWRDQRLTRDYRLWLQYLCWCIQSWMSFHKPILPSFIRGWALRRWPDRFNRTWRMHEWWRDGLGADMTGIAKPLPWPLCEAAFGPFLKPWNRIERFFRSHTGGRSHRCEFTDPKIGALYGGQQGAFMDLLFEEFLENISN